MFAKRLEVRHLGTAALVQAAPAAAGLAELRTFLRAAQSAVTELAETDAKAAKARDWAAADLDRARAALAKFGGVDGAITAHLAGLARVGAANGERAVLPAELQAQRRGRFEADVELRDAESVLALLSGEAETAARDLDKARIGAATVADTVAQHVALTLVGRLRAREREAGELRILISGFGSARSLSAPSLPWPITELLHDAHHGALIDAATGSGAGNGAAVAAGEAWADYRARLLTDPMAVFEAGPAA